MVYWPPNMAAYLLPDEQNELVFRAQRGDRRARDRLIQSNEGMLHRLAMVIDFQGLCDVEDLIQEGRIGLDRAIDDYDPERGAKLITYAAQWIRARMQDELVLWASPLHVPKNLALAAMGRTSLEQASPREETRSAAVDAVRAPQLLDDPVGTDGLTIRDMKTSGTPSSEEILTREQTDRIIRHAIGTALMRLREMNAAVIERRFLRDPPMTLEAIGQEFNFTREYARLLEKAGLQKLRQVMKENAELLAAISPAE